jgi:hypothetical protein
MLATTMHPSEKFARSWFLASFLAGGGGVKEQWKKERKEFMKH